MAESKTPQQAAKGGRKAGAVLKAGAVPKDDKIDTATQIMGLISKQGFQDSPTAPTFISKTSTSPYTITIEAPASDEELNRLRCVIMRKDPDGIITEIASGTTLEPFDGSLIADGGLTKLGIYEYWACAEYDSAPTPITSGSLTVTLS